MKISILAAITTSACLTLTQAPRANAGGRGGFSGGMPHFSSAAPFARPAPAPSFRGATGPGAGINIRRSQPAVRYVQPAIATGSHLPRRSWNTNAAAARPATSAGAPRRTPTTTAPAARHFQANNSRISFAEAFRRYNHAWHDRNWWQIRYPSIVLAGGGYYYWDSGFWYPAWGYDSNNTAYPYDGPIYGFDGLSPDQVIADVQAQLQQAGYYNGPVNGVLDPPTQAAIASYQRDNNLAITSVVDGATVKSLGLN